MCGESLALFPDSPKLTPTPGLSRATSASPTPVSLAKHRTPEECDARSVRVTFVEGDTPPRSPRSPALDKPHPPRRSLGTPSAPNRVEKRRAYRQSGVRLEALAYAAQIKPSVSSDAPTMRLRPQRRVLYYSQARLVQTIRIPKTTERRTPRGQRAGFRIGKSIWRDYDEH